MKILLIDNNTTYKQNLINSLRGHEFEIQTYAPGLNFHYEGKDLVILSGGGGEGREANDRLPTGELWYTDELQFILESTVPILGICMGFELICHAYGSKVEKLPRRIIGHKEISLRKRNSVQKKIISQFKYHDWRIANTSSKHFEVKGVSRSGIEIVQHKTKPILATQFHPEIAGSYNLQKLVQLATTHDRQNLRFVA